MRHVSLLVIWVVPEIFISVVYAESPSIPNTEASVKERVLTPVSADHLLVEGLIGKLHVLAGAGDSFHVQTLLGAVLGKHVLLGRNSM